MIRSTSSSRWACARCASRSAWAGRASIGTYTFSGCFVDVPLEGVQNRTIDLRDQLYHPALWGSKMYIDGRMDSPNSVSTGLALRIQMRRHVCEYYW